MRQRSKWLSYHVYNDAVDNSHGGCEEEGGDEQQRQVSFSLHNSAQPQQINANTAHTATS